MESFKELFDIIAEESLKLFFSENVSDICQSAF